MSQKGPQPDPRPHKPLSVYLRFRAEFMKKLEEEQPNMPSKRRQKKLKEAYRQIPEEEKQRLIAEHVTELQQYNEQLEQWQARHPSQVQEMSINDADVEDEEQFTTYDADSKSHAKTRQSNASSKKDNRLRIRFSDRVDRGSDQKQDHSDPKSGEKQAVPVLQPKSILKGRGKRSSSKSSSVIEQVKPKQEVAVVAQTTEVNLNEQVTTINEYLHKQEEVWVPAATEQPVQVPESQGQLVTVVEVTKTETQILSQSVQVVEEQQPQEHQHQHHESQHQHNSQTTSKRGSVQLLQQIEGEAQLTTGMRFQNESGEYREARDKLLAAELAVRAKMERISALRRQLPRGGELKQDYEFDQGSSIGGNIPQKVHFSQLFAPTHQQLLVYQMMFDETGTEACNSCISTLACFNAYMRHITQHMSFVVVARASIAVLQALFERHGWKNLNFVSAAENTFLDDYQAHQTCGDWPLLTSFERTTDGRIYHHWSSELVFAKLGEGVDPNHLDFAWPVRPLLDFTRLGRAAWTPPSF